MMSCISWITVALPILMSLLQLIGKSTGEWDRNESVKHWILRHSFTLYLLPFLSGSAFNAIAIVNSNAFQLDVFSMGLSKREMHKFRLQRIWSVVLLENLPQIALQISFMATTEGVGYDVATAALIFSSI